MKLLVVDSDEDHRNSLVEMATHWGYVCSSVANEAVAIEKLQTERFDVVISEWKGPGINGKSLGRLLRSPVHDWYTYLIACGEDRDVSKVTQSIEEGADDYIPRTCDPAELRARIQAGSRLLQLQAERNAKGRLERGLMQAAQTLRSMLPHRREDENLKTDWLFRPCAIIGGDLLTLLIWMKTMSASMRLMWLDTRLQRRSLP
jgi:sigma-B regulation protein RsbU (phosphoserine phosphatase)